MLEGVENDASHMSHRGRLSRILDVNRLRLATREEQVEALRRLRVEGNDAERQERGSMSAAGDASDGESRGQNQRFATKLRERFRIRTRAQAPESGDGQ